MWKTLQHGRGRRDARVNRRIEDLRNQVEAAGDGVNIQNRRPPVMPDQFSGQGSWPEFLAHFENCAELNEWTQRQMAQYLRVSLRGPAYLFLGTLPENRRVDYIELVSALEKRFTPENQTELYRAQLRNITRGEKQSLPELGQEIRRLVQLAYPTVGENIVDVLGKDYFIDSIDDKDLRWRVLSG